MADSRLTRVFRWLVCIFSFNFCVPANAGIRPSFNLDYSAWHATEIVVVETSPEDGTFRVVDKRKGDLQIGDVIKIPELRPSADAIPISSYPEDEISIYSSPVNTNIPKQPIGSRMMLFLKRAQGTDQGLVWHSADLMGDMKASAVWLERDQLYCFMQLINPGPSRLVRCSIGRGTEQSASEFALRARVDEINSLRTDFDAVLKENERGVRAAGLRKFVLSDALPAQLAAFHELGKCGSSAGQELREMVNDPALVDHRGELIKALADSEGNAAGPDLNEVLQQEFTYWRSVAASLHEGWWNDDMTAHAPLHQHYESTYAAIIALQQTRYRGALDTIVQFRRLWVSIPRLDANSPDNQLQVECEKLIRLLQSKTN